jgi:hypothetical protein
LSRPVPPQRRRPERRAPPNRTGRTARAERGTTRRNGINRPLWRMISAGRFSAQPSRSRRRIRSRHDRWRSRRDRNRAPDRASRPALPHRRDHNAVVALAEPASDSGAFASSSRSTAGRRKAWSGDSSRPAASNASTSRCSCASTPSTAVPYRRRARALQARTAAGDGGRSRTHASRFGLAAQRGGAGRITDSLAHEHGVLKPNAFGLLHAEGSRPCRI